MSANGKKCIVCEVRPRKRGSSYCANCGGQIKAETIRRANGHEPEPVKYATYNGYVVGFFPTREKDVLTARAVHRDSADLPKCRTLDLNTFLEGFDRDMVKRLKATVLHVNNA